MGMMPYCRDDGGARRPTCPMVRVCGTDVVAAGQVVVAVAAAAPAKARAVEPFILVRYSEGGGCFE